MIKISKNHNMTDQLISFETAKLAKEKGYNQNSYKTNNCYAPEFTDGSNIRLCHSLFHPSVNIAVAPTQSLLQKWLREEYDIHVNVSTRYNPKKLVDKLFYSYDISTKDNFYDGQNDNLDTWLGWNQENNIPILMYHTYNTYEEALEQGLIQALKLIKL